MSFTPLSPPPGLNSDDTTFAAAGRWADGNNVRFRRGLPETRKGWKKPQFFTSGDDITVTLNGDCRKIIHWRPTFGTQRYIAFATTSELVVYSGTGSATDITPSGFVSADTWSLDTWGGYLLAVPRNGKLYEWNGTGDAAEIGNAPDQIAVMLVTEQRQVLALGCNEEGSGTFNPLCIRWSDIEDNTDWTTTSENNAGEQILEAETPILAAQKMGPYVAVWTFGEVWLGEYIGDPGQTYRFSRVARNCGVIGPDAVWVDGQTAYWIGQDKRAYIWTIGSQPEPIPCPIWRDFADNIVGEAPLFDVFAAPIPHHREISFFYQDGRDGTSKPSRYIAYCIGESMSAQQPVWYRGQMAFSAWLAIADARFKGNIAAVDTSGNLMAPENGNTANGSAMSWHIESADQYIDESRRRMMIKDIRPDFEDQAGNVSLTIYMRDFPQGSDVTNGPYTLAVGADKLDFRASGKIARARFSGGSASGSFARFGKQVFDVITMGER
jgi:hypothetical protein